MHRFFVRLFLVPLLALSMLPAHGASVSMNDGLALQFRDTDAAATAVQIGSKPLKLT